jgi:diacylglycerol kinase family enzyme
MTKVGYLIVNPRSGEDSGLEELTRAAESTGLEVHVLVEGDDLQELARAADAQAIGMAGGDGSLAPVAAVCIERSLPFVCVPFGTRNHFAGDLGLDRSDPIAALAAFTDGVERRIDVGRANDRLFLNNVSLGVYARLVHRRERHRRRRETLARVRALAETVQHRHQIGITVDGEPVRARVVLVANNAYQLDLLSLGARQRLDEGLLYLYTPAGLLQREWRGRAAERFVIDARDHRLRAAVDGEPEVLETPIDFRIEPGALRVLLPRGPAA